MITDEQIDILLGIFKNLDHSYDILHVASFYQNDHYTEDERKLKRKAFRFWYEQINKEIKNETN